MEKPKRELRLKPPSYKPTKAELEEDISIDTTPDELAEAVLQQFTIVREGKS
jgi:hypothetical protein